MKQKLLTFIKRLMIFILSLLLLLTTIIFFYIRQDKFGKAPHGKRLERFQQSPNYKDGKFQNLSFTPPLTKGYSMAGVLYNFMFNQHPNRMPADSIPHVKTNLLTLNINEDVLIWFGHSSYFMQLDGKRILVDPVFSGNASPLPGTTKSFNGTDMYSVDDLPPIDYLFITHDHYDHLDYETILQLKTNVKKVICGLGVGSHLEHWGYDPSMIIEKDWHDTIELDSQFHVTVTPARHFSGRSFTRNNTLWCSYLLQTASHKIFIGGDSGYDTHFKRIAEQYGPVDFAILENGQYNKAWHAIHTLPHEVLQAAKDLGAKRVFPVHSSKFALAQHSWDEPLKKITELNKESKIPLVTPIIGEPVWLRDTTQTFRTWWTDIK